MAKTKLKWNSEKILSLSAMTMSFITLLIFMYQTSLMKKQNYLSILPYMSISTTDNLENHNFELNLHNYGVGPAIIESVTMIQGDEKYDLKEYNYNFLEFLLKQAPALDSLKNYSASTVERGLAIPSNSEYNVFSVSKSPADYVLLRSNLNLLLSEGLNFEIIYRSIQNERWMIHRTSEGPTKLD